MDSAGGHDRIHDDRLVGAAAGAAGDSAADEDSGQHRTDRREDARNHPLTREHLELYTRLGVWQPRDAHSQPLSRAISIASLRFRAPSFRMATLR